MGRPQHEPTEQQRGTVRAMAAYGVPEEDIAKVIGIDPKTLRKHYRRELDTAHVEATAKVAQSLYSQATGGNVAAAIFWMKARAGWSERIRTEVTGADGAAVTLQVKIVDEGSDPAGPPAASPAGHD